MFGTNRRKFLQECLELVQNADYINANTIIAISYLSDGNYPKNEIDEILSLLPDLARRTDRLSPPTNNYTLLHARTHDWVKYTILCTNILIEACILKQEGKTIDAKIEEYYAASDLVDHSVHTELMAIFDRGII